MTRPIGEGGAAWAALKQRHQEELAAAEQRIEESAAEVQRLTAVAASCREEVRSPNTGMSSCMRPDILAYWPDYTFSSSLHCPAQRSGLLQPSSASCIARGCAHRHAFV